MGQYYYPACPDTKEYLYSHKFGDGLKLMEFGSGTAMVSGIAALLALPSEDERGSWTGNAAEFGAWAGKRFVVTGDYADEGKFVPPEHQNQNLCSYLRDNGTDISHEVMRALGDIAGPTHPMAMRLNIPKGMSEYSYYVPEGMEAYLDVRQAKGLTLTFKQLHSLGDAEVGLEGGESSYNFPSHFAMALHRICSKFNVRSPEVSNLQVKASADDMRVESVSFCRNGLEVEWQFPVSVATVYKALGIL
jgi:hypothetical protein